jgi:hypothetical protein
LNRYGVGVNPSKSSSHRWLRNMCSEFPSRHSILLCVFFAGTTLPHTAPASNGYFVYTVSSRNDYFVYIFPDGWCSEFTMSPLLAVPAFWLSRYLSSRYIMYIFHDPSKEREYFLQMTIESAHWHTICLTFAIAVMYQFSDTLELGGTSSAPRGCRLDLYRDKPFYSDRFVFGKSNSQMTDTRKNHEKRNGEVAACVKNQ